MASIGKRKRSSGKVDWYISQRHTDDDGNVKQTQIPCKDMREANLLLDEVIEAEKAGHKYIRPPPSTGYEPGLSSVYSSTMALNLTVSELVDQYLEEKSADLIGTTLDNYESLARNYIKPFIGDTHISVITPRFMQNYYNDLPNHMAVQNSNHKSSPKPISARTVKDIHKILRPAFNYAVANDAITINPVIAVKLPKIPKTERLQLTEKQVKQFFEVEKDSYQDLYTKLSYACTLRSGECSALTWDCIDITEEALACEKASIYVNKTVRRMSHKGMEKTKYKDIIYVFGNFKANADSALVLKGTKNDGGERRVYLPITLARQLVEHKLAQEKKIVEVGDNFYDHGYRFVFSQLNGRPYTVDSHSKKIKRTLAENNMPSVKAYSLRHSGSTAKLRASGGNIKSVQGDMGHASSDMLMKVYVAIVDEDRVNNAVLMEERFFSKLGKENDNSTPDEPVAT